jgi:hemoglobin
MKKDIQNRDDLKLLVDTFYDKVKKDDIIKHFFQHVDWEKHLPIMYNFWDNTIFYTGAYSGNPINAHRKLSENFPLKGEHFKRWEILFFTTVDELFEGLNAELIKQRAASISTVMQFKV